MADVPLDYLAPQVPRLRTVLRRVAAVVTVLAVIGVGTVAVHRIVVSCAGVRSGLIRVDGECVGTLTDVDRHFFSDDLRSVQAAIARENAWVHEQWQADPERNRYVRVALLSPMTATAKSFMSAEQIRHSVQGAYVAQRRANHTPDFADPRPLVQLVLANPGSRQTQWRRVVEALERTTDDRHPLVAVIGMGTSITATRDTAHYLSASDADLPMVAGVATSDEFRDIPGFVRTSPSNTDYVRALGAYLAENPELRTGMLVYDDSEPDLYVRDLRAVYERLLGRYLTVPAKAYFGAADPENRTQLFSTIQTSVCNTPRPDLILYAGRALDLDDFVHSLAVRSCRDPISILVGATGLGPFADLTPILQQGQITIINAAGVDPAWFATESPPSGTAPDGLMPFLTAFRAEEFGEPGALDDGYGPTHHDAMATAVMAIRAVTPGLPPDEIPRAGNVRGQLMNLNNSSYVPGAGGRLTFTTTRMADPIGRWIPVISIPPSAAPPAHRPYVTSG
ncbi:ABC transporter substrate-binding protein [Plantactinospora sp. KLBMP9567]|uniref:ABC transporter substrate-binding protein n=1 Tax=Plantactinospora sp. KLBMP9567 TaxID=3085900 RepID=UPI002981B7B3|nr:ABC transporter substrate-binding protein [Plantactinospora sp. KLBMP9567]MDW5329724.1 ABC transporter substrate-binding protein [Plantactinospora sp. KLBMP9567]